MKEDFLHFLWKFQVWNSELTTEGGEYIEVVSPGIHNKNAGPDFLQARIRIGKMTLIGSVEIHIKSSDWNLHKHQQNSAYDNVVLHIVEEIDEIACTSNGCKLIHCCVKNNIPTGAKKRYEKWLQTKNFVSCQEHLQDIRPLIVNALMERLCVESIEKMSENILIDYQYNQQSWKETFYQHLLRAFGLKINADSFYGIARSLPLKVLLRHRENLFQTEALLFGQAGLLDCHFKDNYPNSLREEHSFLQFKYKLLPLKKGKINFLRLRPSSFPTIRLALFAMLLQKRQDFFALITELPNIREIWRFFDVTTSEYWKNHYVFDRKTSYLRKHLGNMALNILVINTIIPFMFAYGQSKGQQIFCDNAIEMLDKLPAENNNVIREWEKYGIRVKNAIQSQGLLQLKKAYCSQSQCLNCNIACEIFRNS
ncbi:MAG: DUF2851 family protein [Bacteroidales bacterium]|jgi:hypothetical protein|nr:DUF2851 family protein [Bacteroidales bacterium]